jgi:hypothetical protein
VTTGTEEPKRKTPPKGSRTHAREVPETVADRVAVIADMMERLEWDGRKSLRSLSTAWGLAESTIKNYSAEASRLITGDAEEARRDITAGAKKLLRQTVTDGDANGFKQVATIWAEVSGAKAPEQRIVTSAASPTEASRLVREAFGEKATSKPNGLNGHSNGHSNGSGSGPVPPSSAGS